MIWNAKMATIYFIYTQPPVMAITTSNDERKKTTAKVWRGDQLPGIMYINNL